MEQNHNSVMKMRERPKKTSLTKPKKYTRIHITDLASLMSTQHAQLVVSSQPVETKDRQDDKSNAASAKLVKIEQQLSSVIDVTKILQGKQQLIIADGIKTTQKLNKLELDFRYNGSPKQDRYISTQPDYEALEDREDREELQQEDQHDNRSHSPSGLTNRNGRDMIMARRIG